MTAFYQTGSELGFKADFSQGPNQGAGVPFSSPDDVGTSVSRRLSGVGCEKVWLIGSLTRRLAG